jgi:TonB family protein
VSSPVAAADDRSSVRHRSIDATLGLAVAASVAVHLVTLAVLATAGIGLGAGVSGWSAGLDPPLEAVLATTPTSADTQKGRITYETAPSATVHIPAPQESAALPASVARQTSPQPLADAGHAGRGHVPQVMVDEHVPRARFAEALEGGALARFQMEVEAPVVLPGKLHVSYPPAALEKHREGTVLVWAIVDPQGAVETTQVVEGTPEFADAVRAALATTRFIPARDGGAPIRYYVTLGFDFRIEDRDTASAAPASNAAGHR